MQKHETQPERPKPATVKRQRPGPKPEVLKIDMDWQEAVKLAMKKKKPPEGWPK
ncbi:MAG TPA: hypothetical protein VG860_24080 [Terriglobia bacterium]|jgi:hypothetical protein|nr:hypothetical protein [Terriglobia bacterium]